MQLVLDDDRCAITRHHQVVSFCARHQIELILETQQPPPLTASRNARLAESCANISRMRLTARSVTGEGAMS